MSLYLLYRVRSIPDAKDIGPAPRELGYVTEKLTDVINFEHKNNLEKIDE